MRKKLVIIITITVILGILYSIVDSRYAIVKVLNKTTQNYIYEPEITMIPDIALEGQPGTGATGPYLYKPIIPIPVVITVSASNYKIEKRVIFLIKGKENVIYLTAD
ncbi:MAG: hypothetical protein ACOX3L_07655 [Lutisporaceae bacterium]|jgi:hypothetical protein